MRLTAPSLVALLLVLLPLAPARADDQGLVIEKAWARATPKAQPTGAVYFIVRNKGLADDVLTGASSEAADKAELHESVLTGTMLQMKALSEVPVPAGKSVIFKQGGMHVMLMGLKTDLVKGEHFPITLTFKTAGPVTASVDIYGVREEGPMGPPPDGMGGMPMH